MFLQFVLLIISIFTVNGQNLEIFEKDKVCTQWLLVSGATMTADINSYLCSSPLDYELTLYFSQYYVRFCCVHKPTTTTDFGPPPTMCGRQSVNPSGTRIVGGQEARPHSWPWLVSIQQDGNHFCGGTLIDEYHVLTAAHCWEDSTVSLQGLTVVAGLHKRSQPNLERIQRRSVRQIYVHPNYNYYTTENDVAIFRLESPIKVTSFVNFICLPGKEAAIREKVMIAGWGTTVFGGYSPDLLQQASIIVMNNCTGYEYFSSTKQICAGMDDYSRDSCQGDSGGPMMNLVNGQWILSGVVSYGEECAKKGNPGVYARVSYYLPWIRSIIR